MKKRDEPGAPASRRPVRRRPRRPEQSARPDPFARLAENLPVQARSRETLSRLLAAAEELLERGGIDAATVPAIAERAGVSVGVVYRRFPDKDTLLRAVYQRFFAGLRESNRRSFELITTMHLPLHVLAQKVVVGMAEGYRRKRGLLRALTHYARAHTDPTFRAVAQEMNLEAIAGVASVFAPHYARIRHPEPGQAVVFGLLAVSAVLHALVVEEAPLQGAPLPADLDAELTRLFFSYLGIKAPR